MTEKAHGVIQFILVCLFLLGAVALSMLLQVRQSDQEEQQSENRILSVEARNVYPKTHRVHLSTTGSLQSRATIDIVPQISGRVVWVNESFFDGGVFDADEILFEVEAIDYELEVQRLEATLAQAQTELELEKAESQAALMEWKQLNGNKNAPTLVLREPQLQQAKAAVKAASAQLDNAKLSLERTKYRLPFAGRVLSSTVDIGRYVVAGQSYGSVFDTSTLEVRASIDEGKLAWLKNEDALDVKIHSKYMGQSRVWDGYLKRGASVLDSATRFASVSFGFKDQPKTILPGVFVSVDILGSKIEGVTLIPPSALQKNGVIWEINADRTLRKSELETLYVDDQYIAMTGATSQTSVVSNSLSGVSEGSKVEIRDIQRFDPKVLRNSAFDETSEGGKEE